jgi:hypothetical protein
MSNTNSNTALAAMLSQYEKNANPYPKTEQKVYDLKNYFTTYLKDKEKTAIKKIRILPTSDGSSPFVEVHGHKIQVESEWKTFICLKHETNSECPFCEAREALLAENKESDKELAKKYSAKKMYVVKVIDRDNESDGPKFWRFNHDYRKQGTLDKIYGVLQAVNKDITDPVTGRDLLVLIARDQNNRPIIQSIQGMDPSPLSEDADLAKSWLEDERTWRDVYAIKTYDYLEIIVKGGVPVWDKEAKKFVDKALLNESSDVNDSLDSELSMGVQSIATTSTSVETLNDEDVDDLPF